METNGGAWSLRRNFVWVLAGEVVNRALPLVVLAHAARSLGNASFGRSQFVLNLLETAIPCVVFGYTYLGILASAAAARDTPEARRLAYARLCVLRLIHAVITIAIGTALLASVPGYREAWLPFLAFSPALLLTALDASYLFIADGQSGRLTRATTASKIVFFALALLFISDPSHAWRFVACMIAVNAATIVYGLSIARSEGLRGNARDWMTAWKNALDAVEGFAWMKAAFPFALVLMLLPLFERGDVFAVERLLDADASGRYQALAKLSQSALGVVSALMIPFLSEFVNVTDEARDKRLFQLSLLVGLGVAGGAFLGASHFGREALTLFYGRDPGDDALLLPLVFLGLFPLVVVYVHGLQIMLLRGGRGFLAGALALGFGVPTALTAFAPEGTWNLMTVTLLFVTSKTLVATALLAAVHLPRVRGDDADTPALRAAPRLTMRFALWMLFALTWCLGSALARWATFGARTPPWDLASVAGGLVALAGLMAALALAARDLDLIPTKLQRRPRA